MAETLNLNTIFSSITVWFNWALIVFDKVNVAKNKHLGNLITSSCIWNNFVIFIFFDNLFEVILYFFPISNGNNILPCWLRWWRICLQYGRPVFDPWAGKIPWRREWLPNPVFCSGEFHGQRSLVDYSPGVAKSWTQLSDFHSLIGNNFGNSYRLYFLGLQSHCRWWLQPWN